jgi:uncharacterized protein YecE (DUF72 family)
MTLLVGTSGFSFPDWKGSFYPSQIKQRDLLAYYSHFFQAVELNYSYYTMPSAQKTVVLARQVPDNFLFTIKAHRSMTHERAADLTKTYLDFEKGIAPLADAGKLGCVLLQFPWKFQYSQDNLAHLAQLPKKLSGVPLVVEFRHRSWLRPDVEELLRERELGFCTVDEPELPGLMPPVVKVTGNTAYLRFHGRNREKWWNSSNSSERYDYLYSDRELLAWIPKIEKMKNAAGRTFIFFNNCHGGQAATNALGLQRILGLKPPDPLPRQGSLF